MISKAMVHLAQATHLSYAETITISKCTETSFHLSLITLEYLPVHLKQFLSLWYVWRKPCTYHAPKLIVSPKGPKGDSTWPTSLRSSIGCVQNDLWGYGTFGANCGSILHRDLHYLQMDRNEILHDPRNLRVPSGVSKWFSSLRYVRCKPCSYLESRLALHPNGPKRASIWASSPRSTIRCVQNDF
jgi:hypothetical protein